MVLSEHLFIFLIFQENAETSNDSGVGGEGEADLDEGAAAAVTEAADCSGMRTETPDIYSLDLSILDSEASGPASASATPQPTAVPTTAVQIGSNRWPLQQTAATIDSTPPPLLHPSSLRAKPPTPPKQQRMLPKVPTAAAAAAKRAFILQQQRCSSLSAQPGIPNHSMNSSSSSCHGANSASPSAALATAISPSAAAAEEISLAAEETEPLEDVSPQPSSSNTKTPTTPEVVSGFSPPPPAYPAPTSALAKEAEQTAGVGEGEAGTTPPPMLVPPPSDPSFYEWMDMFEKLHR